MTSFLPRPSRGRASLCLPLLATLLVPAHSAFAQAVNGTLLGTVSDNSGASVANAHVIVTATDTGVRQETVSNESGNYSLPGLQPGSYTVTVEAQGFSTSIC